MFERLKYEFEAVGLYDVDVIYSIVEQLETNDVATIEINLDSWDLIERLTHYTQFQVNTTLLYGNDNLYLIKIYK